MKRQAFVRVLLSLLLLVSQQMASTHVVSHMAGVAERAATATAAAVAGVTVTDEELALAVTQHKNCSQCLAFAQLAGAISGKPAASAIMAPAAFNPPVAASRTPDTRIALAFRSRAPPILS